MSSPASCTPPRHSTHWPAPGARATESIDPEDQTTMHFNLTQPPHRRLPFYLDMMETIGHGLRDLGHTTVDAGGFAADRINMVFAYYTGPQAFPERSIFYQLEPVCDWRMQMGHIPIPRLCSNVVWDYSRLNIERLRHHGVAAHYVPVGHHPAMQYVPVADEEDIDGLFYSVCP